MNGRPILALRSAVHFPLLSAALMAPLLGCEIQLARTEPDDPEVLSQNPFGSGNSFAGPSSGGSMPVPVPPFRDSEAYGAPGTNVPVEDRQPWMEYRELIAIDPDLVQGPLASNAEEDAPLSFRSQMQWLSASTRDPLAFVRSWFDQWLTANATAPELPEVAARPGAGRVLIDSWLGGSDAAAPDAGYVPRFTPSWADAPFVLIAIVNRVDLASAACDGFAGELRYIYSALDVASGEPLDMTVIVEIPYPTLRPAAEWARAWQDIGELPPGASYASGIEELAREVQSEADPLRVRVRTNEIALGSRAAPGWEMREFHTRIIDAELALSQVPLESTPRADADPAALAAHVIQRSDEILQGPVALPMELRAGAAAIPTPDFSWSVLGVSDRLRRAFSVETCNGCHGGDTPTLPFRHVAPGRTRTSRAQLSRFLYDPEAQSDELRRRTDALAALANIQCAPAEPASPYTGL